MALPSQHRQGMTGTQRMTKERQRQIAQRLAAHRRRAARRRRLRWLVAAIILVALTSAVTVAVFHWPNQAAASGTGELGPEGILLQTGVPLASIAGAASGQPVDGIRCEASEQVTTTSTSTSKYS